MDAKEIFDASVHATGKDGKGVLKKDGTYRRLPVKRAEVPNALLKRLEQLEATVNRQAAELAERKPDAVTLGRLRDAEAELAALKRPEPLPSSAPAVPYQGMVRALVDCYYGSYRKAGDVFEVNVKALWTDDPFEPVTVTYDPAGAPIVQPSPAARADFRSRPTSHEALARLAAIPHPASQH
jgi:hypothetical protein